MNVPASLNDLDTSPGHPLLQDILPDGRGTPLGENLGFRTFYFVEFLKSWIDRRVDESFRCTQSLDNNAQSGFIDKQTTTKDIGRKNHPSSTSMTQKYY